MKAALLTGIREMAIRDVPDPQLREPHDVLLRLKAVGVCGSDVHYYTTGRIGSQVVQYPFTVGHECAAVVEAVGPAVTRVRPGDRIAVEPALSCHVCDQCLAGRPHTCRKLKFLGCPGQIEGCLSEFLVMPEECCFHLPDSASFEDGALCEPLAIGVYAVQQAALPAEAKIGILGLGPIGLSVLLAAQAEKASEIYASDPLRNRGDTARRQGATWTGSPDTDDIVREISRLEPGLLDVVFECSGKQEALDQGVALLKPGGKLMLIGIPEFDRFSFSADFGRRKELCLQNVRRQNHCLQKTLDGVAAGRYAPQFMITHHFPLADCATAFDLVAGYSDGVIKAMIDFS